MIYQIAINLNKKGLADDASIVGLKDEFDKDEYIHIGHNDFSIVWNEETKKQDVVEGIDKFFGGIGEGQSFTTFVEAIHCSLYDLFQYNQKLNAGDYFECSYKGKDYKFKCEGVHVLRVES